MSEQSELPPLVPEMAHALRLLDASHQFYAEIVGALRDNISPNGDPDIPAMVMGFNRALTGFAPRDREIRKILDDFAG